MVIGVGVLRIIRIISLEFSLFGVQTPQSSPRGTSPNFMISAVIYTYAHIMSCCNFYLDAFPVAACAVNRNSSAIDAYLGWRLRPNSITSICCGCVVQLVRTTNPQQIEVMEFGLNYCSSVRFPCDTTASLIFVTIVMKRCSISIFVV